MKKAIYIITILLITGILTGCDKAETESNIELNTENNYYQSEEINDSDNSEENDIELKDTTEVDVSYDYTEDIETDVNIQIEEQVKTNVNDSFDKFIAGEINADGNGVYGEESFNISELKMDEDEWDSYSVGERIDLDNDGENELILRGPYGGMYLDCSGDKVKVFAKGEGTAINLSYTTCDNEIWVVYSDTMHGGRKCYRLEKHSGAENVTDIINLAFYEQDENETEKYYLNEKEVSEAEYDQIYQKFFGSR